MGLSDNGIARQRLHRAEERERLDAEPLSGPRSAHVRMVARLESGRGGRSEPSGRQPEGIRARADRACGEPAHRSGAARMPQAHTSGETECVSLSGTR